MFAIMSFPLMLAIGFSVDYAQTSSKRSELQIISDAVALAVVKGMPISNSQARQAGNDLFVTMIEEMKTGLLDVQHTITFESFNPYIAEVKITALQRGTFGNLVNVGDVRQIVNSRAINEDPKVEIALAVDVSWSMDDPRMSALKVAMDEFMNIVEAEVSSDGIDARIAIIPFAGFVNLPTSAQYWWEGPGNNIVGSHCIAERDDDDHRMTNSTNGAMAFPEYDKQPKNCPAVKALPLTTNMLAVRDHIRKVGARSRGAYGTANWGTSVHRAAAWANRMLDPRWYTFFSGGTRPTPGNGSVRKFAMIMTDGKLYNGGSWDYDTGSSTVIPTAQEYLYQACNNLRLKGVDVFTIGFKTKEVADNDLAKCANEGQFIKGNNTTELIDAFRQVAANIGGKTPRLLY